ncbi:helicase [Hymenobacter qilianensis]|uniref:DEAD/DEAH box helicase n=2 Tax=Hymenobacter qilianensis TaxID=1385715 RepID=A0A7H0GT38_9BACT|nr:DEAD/DEAH box helicase [Hymenobacter qilianensis]QNP51454.1 DEAD/DEAH box helicase [Hymenobacter qilianensis]GGF75008.1 helicase [Hymenobacter qilianensis]
MSSPLLASLTRGFLDHTTPAQDKYLPQLLVNDRARGKTVLSAVLRHLGECEEFWFTVAFATKQGVITLLSTLQELERRGIPGRVLVSQYLDFTQPEALQALLQLSNITLKIATTGNFHAKGYLFRKGVGAYDLLIGSSNLTAGALKTNKEWNLQVSANGHGELMHHTLAEFAKEFAEATPVDEAFIEAYQQVYQAQALRVAAQAALPTVQPVPNAMQVEALASLAALRAQGQRKALLISATGTGKTYLSAFDALQVKPGRLLFVVHRLNIAEAALQTFQRVFGPDKTMSLYSGRQQDTTADFLFCTVQTLAQTHHLERFAPDQFDYITIDETHRSGADSYQRILAHFRPRFLLGMTATPERTDGYDIFQQFDHNIAYEIRLQRALAEDMLCPFHYFGLTDLTVDNEPMPEVADFALLVAEDRINHILAQAAFYGCDTGPVRGLIFCRSNEESEVLSAAFNTRGLRTVNLNSKSTDTERSTAITRLESDDASVRLDYLLTVDIFNEGIDIPRLNQVILLRPTQSAIVFVQQLGRGLRKTMGKEYLTVLDFIGNYRNNYLVPVALFGDTTYNKDTLRKLLAAGSSLLPGVSTINFDRIAQEQIYASIDAARLNSHRDLVDAYNLLKSILGRSPLMMDFLAHAGRDPFLYVSAKGSFFNFAAGLEKGLVGALTPEEQEVLALIATHLANAKRIDEVVILDLLLQQDRVSTAELRAALEPYYGPTPSPATLDSCVRNLNFDFVGKPKPVVTQHGASLGFAPAFAIMVAKPVFLRFLQDALDFAKARYRTFMTSPFSSGFFLYQKYTRRDVCRILNWPKDESSTVYGYKIKDRTCPLFVNYHKAEDIAESTNYEDGFISTHEFNWMSKSNRSLNSPEIQKIAQAPHNGLRLPLFVKKSNDEGLDFYYMGDVKPVHWEAGTLPSGGGGTVPVVKFQFTMDHPVEEAMYAYLTSSQADATRALQASNAVPEVKSLPRAYSSQQALAFD